MGGGGSMVMVVIAMVETGSYLGGQIKGTVGQRQRQFRTVLAEGRRSLERQFR